MNGSDLPHKIFPFFSESMVPFIRSPEVFQ